MQLKPVNKVTFQVFDLVKADPLTASLISKATASTKRPPTRDQAGNRKNGVFDANLLKAAPERRASRNANTKMAMEILPDLEMAAATTIASILSPVDMGTTELTYSGPKTVYSSELTASLINRITEYFETDYKIKPMLPEILRKALIDKGCDALAIVPENAVDDLINGDRFISAEALSFIVDEKGLMRNVGVLGSPTDSKKEKVRGLSIEAFHAVSDPDRVDKRLYLGEEGKDTKNPWFLESIVMTDNISVLKIPQVHDKMRQQSVRKATMKRMRSQGLEAFSDLADELVERHLRTGSARGNEPVVSLKKQSEIKRSFIGKPMTLDLPSESITVVHSPGDYQKRVGAFVLLDAEGYPIRIENNDILNQNTTGMFQSGGNQTNVMARIHANLGMGGTYNPGNRMQVETITRIWGDLIEKDWINRIKNGVHGGSVEIASNTHFYQVMMARANENKFTQVLYIPAEYLSYIAFRYDDDGNGKSLVDNISTLNMMRSVVLFNDMLTGIKNSTPRTRVSMNVPEHDPNPEQTIEESMDEIFRTRNFTLPRSIAHPQDAVDMIQRLGYEWEITGNTAIPDITYKFEQTNSSYTKPDSTLSENLEKMSAYNFGMSPEQIKEGFSGEVATSVAARSIMYGKRIMGYQDVFCPQLSDRMRKIMVYDQSFVDSLKEMILEKIDQVKLQIDESSFPQFSQLPEESKKILLVNRSLNEFLWNLEVSLPRPPSVTLENQLQLLRNYSELLDAALDHHISDQLATSENAGTIAGQVGTIRAMVKAYYMRRYMATKGILPELSDLTNKDDDGQPMINVIDETAEHLEAVIRSCVKIVAKTKDMANAADKDMEKLGSDGAGSDSGTDFSTTPDDGTGGGIDEFGLDEGDGGLTDPEAAPEGDETTDPTTADNPPDGGDGEAEPELEPDPVADK